MKVNCLYILCTTIVCLFGAYSQLVSSLTLGWVPTVPVDRLPCNSAQPIIEALRLAQQWKRLYGEQRQPIYVVRATSSSKHPAERRQQKRELPTIKVITASLLNCSQTAIDLVSNFYGDAKSNGIDRCNSFTRFTTSRANRQATRIDKLVNNKTYNNDSESLKGQLLLGVPIGVKDNLCMAGEVTTAGSLILRNYKATYDATVVAKLEEAGAIIVGRTNMDEFAMGNGLKPFVYKQTVNPRDYKRSPGGSSAGSASAVAAGELPVAIGSDTGGSIRLPAAWCGCVGLKPTYGRVSRYGLVPYACSLDTIGVISNCVEDAALVLESIAGHDVKDGTSLRSSVPPFGAALENIEERNGSPFNSPLKNIRIGVLQETYSSEFCVSPEVQVAFQHMCNSLKSLGSTLVDFSIPFLQECCSAYFDIAMAESVSNLARYDGVLLRSEIESTASVARSESVAAIRSSKLGIAVQNRLLLGAFSVKYKPPNSDYEYAKAMRNHLRDTVANAFKQIDCIVSPTCPTVAKRFDGAADKRLISNDELFLTPASLAGLPALTVPYYAKNYHLPFALQVIGKPQDEETVLKVGFAFERHNLKRN